MDNESYQGVKIYMVLRIYEMYSTFGSTVISIDFITDRVDIG